MMQTVPAAFWLLPCPADALRLQAIVDRLADAHAAPPFAPHVTLHVAALPAAADVDGALARLAERHAPLALAALATGHSKAYYKALYVNLSCELQDGPGLVRLRRDLVLELNVASAGSHRLARGAVPGPDLDPAAVAQAGAGYQFDPHLSLLYGELPDATRSELASAHDLHGHTLRFDRIAAVRPAAGRRELARVADWDVYGHRRLRG
jgi:hypothetical protein